MIHTEYNDRLPKEIMHYVNSKIFGAVKERYVVKNAVTCNSHFF